MKQVKEKKGLTKSIQVPIKTSSIAKYGELKNVDFKVKIIKAGPYQWYAKMVGEKIKVHIEGFAHYYQKGDKGAVKPILIDDCKVLKKKD